MVDENADGRRSAVARALELGINYFDTAAAYGHGRSEKNLGITLAELSAKVIVATKVTLELPDLDDIPAAVERSIAGSLARLKVQHLDIVHLHNRIGAARAARSAYGSGALIAVDDALGVRGVAETFRRLQADGRVGAVGCCAFGGEHDAVAQVIDSGAFASVIVNYSILNSSAWQSAATGTIRDYAAVGARAAQRGMAVVALRVLEGGVLASFGPVNANTDSNEERRMDQRRVEALRALSGQDADPAPMAIRFALSNAEISNVLIGFSDENQIAAAAECAARGPLPRDTLTRIKELQGRDFY
jgi:L-galactose dehydrogenase/L-glyceraldehyde 3-phosphate reductase